MAVVTLNQPERLNAMTFGMRRDLCEIFCLAQLDDGVRVVVIAGTGRGFCAGMSLRAPVNLQTPLRPFSQELTRSIGASTSSPIAAVNGFAIQIGLSMGLRMGYQPDEGGHWLLVEHLGVKRALDFVMRSDHALLERAIELATDAREGAPAWLRHERPEFNCWLDGTPE